PPPTLVFTTVSRRLVNVAATDLAAVSSTVQAEPFILVQPVHDVKAAVEAGVAVSTTVEPGTKRPEHDCVQLMPGMSLVTVPAPPPTPATVTFSRLLVKVAVTVRAALISTVHVLPFVDAQPLQDVKADLESVLLACRCTVVDGGNFCVQVAPQSMAAPGSVPT